MIADSLALSTDGLMDYWRGLQQPGSTEGQLLGESSFNESPSIVQGLLA